MALFEELNNTVENQQKLHLSLIKVTTKCFSFDLLFLCMFQIQGVDRAPAAWCAASWMHTKYWRPQRSLSAAGAEPPLLPHFVLQTLLQIRLLPSPLVDTQTWFILEEKTLVHRYLKKAQHVHQVDKLIGCTGFNFLLLVRMVLQNIQSRNV